MAKSSASKSPKPAPKKPQSKEQPFTQENFEKELKTLASKAQEETWGKWTREQAWILVQSATLLTLAATYSNVSQLTLSPVYGSIPSSIWHSKGVMTACFLGWSSNLFIRRNLSLKPKKLLPVIACYIPMIQFFLFKSSDFLGGKWGPLIIEAFTFLPLLLLSVSCTATILDDLELSNGRFAWLSDAMPGVGSFVFLKCMEYVSGNTISRTIGASFIQTRLGLQILLSGLYTLFAPSRLLLFAVPAMLHTAFFNTHVPTSSMTTALNATMVKNGWSLIDRHESLTGYISIIESAQQGFRVMRCDHSLLGGVWLASSTRNRIAEPIYGIFVMLEAIRLIEVTESVLDSDAKALVVGLGIGTTPAALIAHGINTTIVEIDPTVYNFARKYFALPTKHNAVIADAVSYASDLAKKEEKYDYIVHDVFTGGAEPVNLFTVEFVQDLKSILKPGGVIAINYAGDLLLPSARIVINTILSIFPTCRIYRESPASAATPSIDFTNLVIFCTNSPLPITFRTPVDADYLKSEARKMFLVPEHEVEKSMFEERDGDGGLLWSNAMERFEGWQQKSALGHWGVMRTVLPANIWEEW